MAANGKLSSSSDTNIPLIDISCFCSSDSDSTLHLKVSRDLVAACHDTGFVYITGHGVPQEDLDRAFAISKKFFDLPQEQKMTAPHPPGYAIHRGYCWPGFEKVSGISREEADNDGQRREVKESYEIGSEENPEMPNVWPPSDFVLPEFRPFMASFYWTLFSTASHILRALAIGLDLHDEDYLLKYHSGHNNQLRLLHYPPVPAKDVESGEVTRMPAHSDYSSITLLFQDDCGGLQVEDPTNEGKFVDVPPIPGTLVFDVGDLLMRWTNDHLKSTSHRVNLPPLQDRFTGNERMTRARYSIPYFLTTKPDVLIECLRTDAEHPPKYKPVTRKEYTNELAAKLYGDGLEKK